MLRAARASYSSIVCRIRKFSLHAELAGVYVAGPYRRQGIARELVSEALAAARARGVRKIVLHPTDRTRELYRSFGFSESGQMRMS